MEEEQYSAVLAVSLTLLELVETRPDLSRPELLSNFIYMILHAWKVAEGQEVINDD
jgi:hypothetical protein